MNSIDLEKIAFLARVILGNSYIEKTAVDPAKELYDAARSEARFRDRQSDIIRRKAVFELDTIPFRQRVMSGVRLRKALESPEIVSKDKILRKAQGSLGYRRSYLDKPVVLSELTSPRATELLNKVIPRYSGVPASSEPLGIMGRAGKSLGLLEQGRSLETIPTGNLLGRLRGSSEMNTGLNRSTRHGIIDSSMLPAAKASLTGRGKAVGAGLGLGAGGIGLAALARKLLGKSAPAAPAAMPAAAARINPYLAGLFGAGALGAGALGAGYMSGRE